MLETSAHCFSQYPGVLLKAILIGATGLVGSEILKNLSADNRFNEIVVPTRRHLTKTHPKVKEHLVNFDNLMKWKEILKGDVIFSALGTTLKKAGSKEAQSKVDYHYQFNIAHSAHENGVPILVQISSTGADPQSPFFYLRMKGELEEALKKLNFKKCCMIQPGPLAGKRERERLQEKWLIQILNWFPKIPGMESYWPIQATDVGALAINEVFTPQQGFYQLKPKILFEKLSPPSLHR